MSSYKFGEIQFQAITWISPFNEGEGSKAEKSMIPCSYEKGKNMAMSSQTKFLAIVCVSVCVNLYVCVCVFVCISEYLCLCVRRMARAAWESDLGQEMEIRPGKQMGF